MDVESGETRALTGAPGVHDHEPVWSPDGATIAFTRNGTSGSNCASSTWPRATSARSRMRTPTFGARLAPDGTRIAAVSSSRFTSDLVIVDVATGAVDAVAPGGIWETPLWTADGALAATYKDQETPPELRLVREGRTASLLAPAPRAVAGCPHVTPEEVSFVSLDGTVIEALLFGPAVRVARCPQSSTRTAARPSSTGTTGTGMPSTSSTRGMRGSRSNFRGSTGRGKTFERLNVGDWGGGDRDDCLAAADFLRTLDWVDGDKLGIFGASYGSYMALCAAVEDAGDRFRCAVCKYGDCDLLTTWSQGDRDGVYYCGENMLGHPSVSRDVYLRGSPGAPPRPPRRTAPGRARRAGQRVHPKQSEELVAELRRLGKTFEYVTYPTEAHGFLRAGPQIDFYRRLERFLDWYLL